MKKIHFISIVMLALGALTLTSCSDTWDGHYGQQEAEIDSDKLHIVNSTATDYLKSTASLSSMYELFNETGVIETMNERDQLFTILVVRGSRAASNDDIYLAKAHISDIAFSPSNLYNGLRMLMWNGKYLNVTIDENDDIYFNGTKTLSITKVNDGYIYELESYVDSPRSMYEMIENLSDDYSIFREMILSRNEKTFDRENSMPIGIDNTGSTVYDSVFTVINPYFLEKSFDLMSESTTATMLIPSNTLINKTLADAKAKLTDWNLTRADSILNNWCFQAMFFNKTYSKADFEANEDLTSVFSKQWRTTVQKVDLDNPVTMSNGVAYYIQEMRIPTNVLIFRLKDFYYHYESLTEADKEIYYKTENLTFQDVVVGVAAWSGWPGVFPTIQNIVLRYNPTDAERPDWKMEFIPYQFEEKSGGGYDIRPYRIPPGTYDFCVGFVEKMGFNLDILFDDIEMAQVGANEGKAHYDRNGQGYPEGYSTSLATNSKKGNYDRDGLRVGSVTITGDEAVEVVFTFSTSSHLSKRVSFHHWCLKPTKDCY